MRQTNNCFCVGDVYNAMKPKQAKKVRYQTYFNMFLNILLDMFEWNGLPETIPARFLEMILHSKGEVFVGRETEDSPLICAIGSLTGEIDDYSMGTECIAITPRHSLQGKRNIDIAYGINNKTATADTLVYWLSHMLGENDLSMELVSTYARLLPIPKVNDDKDKAMFDDIIDKLIDGNLKTYASKNAFADLADGESNIFNITDASQNDKLQYLSRFADDIIKRFYNFYGQPLQTQNKSAQTISDELHGMDSVSFILPLQMLQCRQDLCDNINRIFDLNVSVRFSQTWEIEYRKYVCDDSDADGVSDSIETPANDTEINSDVLEDETDIKEPLDDENANLDEIDTENENLYRESDETITEDETESDVADVNESEVENDE